MKRNFIIKVLLLTSCGAALVFSSSGCKYFTPQNVAEEALEEAKDKAKGQLDKIKNINISGSELSGNDDQGRPLWKVTAKKVHAAGTALEDSETGIPDAELIDATAVLYKEGKPDAELSAPRIQIRYLTDNNLQLFLSEGVKAVSRGEWTGKRGDVTITTPQATVNVKERRLWADQGVKSVQGEGAEKIELTSKTLLASTSLQTADLGGGTQLKSAQGTMSSQKAHWDWHSGKLVADDKIVAQGKDIHITGQHLEADTRTHVITVTSKVIAKSPKGTATAKKVVYYWNSGQLNASGGVSLNGDGTAMSASSVQTTREMQNATASGDVHVTREDVDVRANGATVTKTGDNAFTVTGNGNVRVVRGDLNMRANKATVTKSGKSTFTATGTGAVRMQNSQGTASANSATWKNGQITASGNVKLSHAGYILSGAQLVTDDKFTHATLSGGAHGSMPDGGTVAAPKVVYDNGKITATGGVSGKRGNMRLSGDRLESSDSGNILNLQGNVTLKNDKGTVVTAPQARYDRKKNEVYAWGGVTLRDAEHQLTQQGKTLTADINLGQAVLTEVSGSGKIDLSDKNLF